jgi:hypothetical protein
MIFHAYPEGNTRGSKKAKQAGNMPVSKKQTQIWFRQETGHGKNDPDRVEGSATQEWLKGNL